MAPRGKGSSRRSSASPIGSGRLSIPDERTNAQWQRDYGCGLDNLDLRWAARPTALVWGFQQALPVAANRLTRAVARLAEQFSQTLDTKLPGIRGTVRDFHGIARNLATREALDALPDGPMDPRGPGHFIICEAGRDGTIIPGPVVKRGVLRLAKVMELLEQLSTQVDSLAAEAGPTPPARKRGRPTDLTIDRICSIATWVEQNYEGEPRSRKDQLIDVLTAARAHDVPLGPQETEEQLKVVENALRGRTSKSNGDDGILR